VYSNRAQFLAGFRGLSYGFPSLIENSQTHPTGAPQNPRQDYL
jgi:hypothetical protein